MRHVRDDVCADSAVNVTESMRSWTVKEAIGCKEGHGYGVMSGWYFVTKWFERLCTEATNLGMNGETLPRLLALFFLNGLPPSFQTFVDFISLSNNGTDHMSILTPDALTAKFMQHIRTMAVRQDGPTDEEFAMRVDKKTATCHGCGKKGHFKSECWHNSTGGDSKSSQIKNKGRRGNRGGSRPNRGRGRAEATKATEPLSPTPAPPSSSSQKDWGQFGFSLQIDTDDSEGDTELAHHVESEAWILDTGCSNHTCSDRSMLVDFESYVTPIKTANGQYTQTVGRGKMIVSSTIKGTTRHFAIDNVLYIPNFANLISVGQLLSKKVVDKVTFVNSVCIVKSKGKTVLEGIPFRKNLWRLKIDEPSVRKEADPAESAFVLSAVDRVEIIHRRLGHASAKAIAQLVKDDILPPISPQYLPTFASRTCVPCVQGKRHRTPFQAATTKASKPLERIHTDLQGPMPAESFTGRRYMMTIWDEATPYHWSFAITHKSDAFATYKTCEVKAERQLGAKVRSIRSDNGGEFTSNEFRAYLQAKGIKIQTTIAHTPQQNGKAERGNRTIEEKITCLLHDTNGIPESGRARFWAEAMSTATFLINRLPTSANDGKTPYEAIFGRKPPLEFIRTFGSRAFAFDRTHKKHQSKTIPCILLGYGEDAHGKKAYRLRRLDNC